MPLLTPIIPSTRTPLEQSGLDAWTAKAGVRCAGRALARLARRGSMDSAARWLARSVAALVAVAEIGKWKRRGFPSLGAMNAELSTLPRWGGINLKGECYE